MRPLALGFGLAMGLTLNVISQSAAADADVSSEKPLVAVRTDTAVVASRDFQAALEPWLKRRLAQGHAAVLIDNSGTSDAIRERIVRLTSQHPLRFVVLVGDAPIAGAADPATIGRTVPTFLPVAKVNVNFGPDKDIAADSPYGDLDNDGVPELAVGRLTADTPVELTAMIDKIAAYEDSADFGPWRRKLNFVAGMGGFGQVADSVLESTAKKFIAEGLAPSYALTMTYGSWRSPYCPDQRRFHDVAVDRLNEGSLFWVYIGHGQRHALDRVKVPDGEHHIFGARDVAKLHASRGLPIAFFLACYTGAFDDKRDCLAEDLLRAPGAPVAVVSGSRVTMPYAMTVMATAVVDACFVERQPTLGEVLLAAKRNMVLSPRDDETSKSMDLLARTLNPNSSDLAAERQEHVLMFNLIGDPLLRLRQPQAIEIEAPATASPGETIHIAGRSPVDGACTIELVVRRDRLAFRPPPRKSYDGSDAALVAYAEVYRRANDPCLDSAACAISGGAFTADLRVPDDARGPCHVRVYVEGQADFALGSADLTIGRATAAHSR
jgi:hypothetical protein